MEGEGKRMSQSDMERYSATIQLLLEQLERETDPQAQISLCNQVNDILTQVDDLEEKKLPTKLNRCLNEESPSSTPGRNDPTASPPSRPRSWTLPPPYESPPSYHALFGQSSPKVKEWAQSSINVSSISKQHYRASAYLSMPSSPAEGTNRHPPMMRQSSFYRRRLELAQVRYMLSTGIRCSMIKIMGSEIFDPWLLNQQLQFQEYHFKPSHLSRSPYLDEWTPDAESAPLMSYYPADYEFTFTEYSQFLFQEFRWQNQIGDDHYVHSLAGHPDGCSLEAMNSEGKSSAYFFRAKDGKYVVKTLTEAEFQFFRSILSSYFEYMLKSPHSLLTRVYGLHQVTVPGQEPLYFVVMENVLPTKNIIRYDLKGSKSGRRASKATRERGGTLKDLDLDRPFFMCKTFQELFFQQIRGDCTWLEQHMIMDYSLLVGVETRPACPTSESTATSIFRYDKGGFRATDDEGKETELVYYMGIIDILQPYNMRKKVEHAFKSIKNDSQSISCVAPSVYSQRFQQFLRNNTSPGELELLMEGFKLV